ncbi:universal stress protein [Desulfallas sp. Bu1-1]|uniref:universal stress protein n=1 Tax=Desulfallas sp. Bu1-1 TaxID=2787620 RepID=UPI00189F80BE|nr:universal stress protein [Desulfallas sp. Bu1-1]MBF7082896.1 universal stress protein [Desulfallas sp. Bu1-1]
MLSKLAEELLAKNQLEAVDTSINRIILAVDGSAPAIEATKYAMGLAKRNSSEIIAVFVDPDGEDAVIPENEWELLAKKTKRVRYGLAGLKLAHKYGKAYCINVKLLLLSGNPVKQIINVAEKEGADLIITGDTGLTGIKRIALGSIAEAVVEASDIPVLVVKRRKVL